MNFYNNIHPYYCGIDLHARILYPRILSWTRLSVCFLGLVAPTKKLFIVILCKAFAVKSISLKNVQSNV